MDFGIMFFSSNACKKEGNIYDLLKRAASFADEHGFCAIWTPERHFHEFGGQFPNPSVISAALAMITTSIQIRAGSLIAPLHNTVRIAEEWSVVDNLSSGRAAISFGSGWNINDFIFYPDRYAHRQKAMYEQIKIVKQLWRGMEIVQISSEGKEVNIKIYPKPVQADLPIWVTSSGNVETFVSAGAVGANVLTHLIGQDLDSLESKIGKYRGSLEENGFDPQLSKVSLMLHTFLGPDAEAVKARVRTPFREYLRSAIRLESLAAQGGGVISGGHKIEPHDIPESVMEDLLDITFDRYFHTGALMGTPDSCKEFVSRLKEIGVDEVACLIDFIDDPSAIMESLVYVDELRASFSADVLNHTYKHAETIFTADLES